MPRTKYGLPGIYNATPITLPDGAGAALAVDENGHLITTGGGGVGAVYNVTPPTYTDGQDAELQTDVNGNLKVTLATTIAGEDITNDVQKVENRYTPFSITAEAAVKSGAGFLHTVSIAPTTATPTAGLLTIYDNTAESGTVLYSEWIFATTPGHTLLLDVVVSTGIYVGFDGTLANVRVSGSYR